jgi:nucleoside-diphosphate-sugar epimerase
VQDVVRAFVAAVGAEGGVFNVGTGIETSVRELWQGCTEAAGLAAEAAQAEPRLGELQRSSLDAGRAERTLGWRAEVDLPTGLRRTWESFQEE